MRGNVRTIGIAMIVGSFLLAGDGTPVFAQPAASSLEELQALAVAGSTVKVTDSTGREVKGRLAGVTREALTLAVGEALRTYDVSQVREVRVPVLGLAP